MNRKRLLTTALVLCLLLGACSGGGNAPATEAPTGVSTGRYAETALTLPDGIDYVYHMALLEDSRLYLMVRGPEGLNIHTSPDLGSSWTTHSPDWLGEVEGTLNSAYAAAPGELYFSTASLEGVSRLYRTDITTLTELDATALNAAATEAGMKEIRITEGGDLLINCFTNLLQIEGIDGRVKAELPIGSVSGGRVITFGDRVLANRNGQIETYALGTGDYITGFSTDLTLDGARYDGSGLSSYLASDEDGQGLYFVNTTGIFHSDLDGTAARQVVDGAITSMSLPRMNPVHLVPDASGRLLLLANNAAEAGRYYLFSYAFDETLSAEPAHNLRLFTLRDNATVRQAVGAFHAANPDVKIAVEVGTAGDIPASDALRTLSTELLAGSGPDILILDGLPIDSYIEQGVLRDLTPLLGAGLDGGDYLTAVAETYRTADGLYALPARFSVPVLMGTGLEGVKNLTDLVDLMEQQNLDDMGILSENLADRFYAALVPGWLADDTLDRDQLRSDMAQLGRLHGLIAEIPADDNWRPYRDNQGVLGMVAGHIMAGTTEIGYAELGDFAQLAATAQVMEEGRADSLVLFPAGGVYIPAAAVGLNNAGGQLDLAERFIETLLSREVLRLDFQDGFPVLRTALDDAAKTRAWAANNDMIGMGGYYYRPDTREYAMTMHYFHWPEQAYLDAFARNFDDLRTPSPGNAILKGLLVAEIADYLEGLRDLDDTVDAIASKVAIYRNE